MFTLHPHPHPSSPLCCFSRLWLKKAHESKMNKNIQAEGSPNPHGGNSRDPQRRHSPGEPTPQWGCWTDHSASLSGTLHWDSGGLEFSQSINLLNSGAIERPTAQKGVEGGLLTSEVCPTQMVGNANYPTHSGPTQSEHLGAGSTFCLSIALGQMQLKLRRAFFGGEKLLVTFKQLFVQLRTQEI